MVNGSFTRTSLTAAAQHDEIEVQLVIQKVLVDMVSDVLLGKNNFYILDIM